MIVACPSCGIPLDVPEALLGNTVKCASCATTFLAGVTPSAAGTRPPALPSTAAPYAEPRRSRRDHPRADYEEEELSWVRDPRRNLLPHRGGMVLALGIVGVALSPLSFCGLFGFVFGIASLAVSITGLVLGQADLRQMAALRMDPDGRGMTNAGWICALIGVCISGLAMLLALLCMLAWGGATSGLFFRL